jgi:hypothetical protein
MVRGGRSIAADSTAANASRTIRYRIAAMPRAFSSVRALPAASLRGNSCTTRCHVARACEASAQVELAVADLEECLAGLGRAGGDVQHLLELDLRLAIVVLDVVRLSDPVLRVGHQRVLRILGHEVEEVEHGLTVLADAEGRLRQVVHVLGPGARDTEPRVAQPNAARATMPRIRSRPEAC